MTSVKMPLSIAYLDNRSSGLVDRNEIFKNRIIRELNPALSLDQRIAAAHNICKDINSYSADVIAAMWSVIEDWTSEDAPLKAREAARALLKTLYDLIVTSFSPSEASLQISALADLTRGGQYLEPFETELMVFLTSLLESLYIAAADARERQHGENKSKNASNKDSSSTDNLSSRTSGLPKDMLGEVKSLRDTFYLIDNIITHNWNTSQDAQIENLIESITSIARRTIAKKDLHGVVKVLRAIATRAKVPSNTLVPCIRVLCTIYGVPRISFEDELWICLKALLRSDLPRPEAQRTTINTLLGSLTRVPTETEANQVVPMIRGTLFAVGRIAKDSDVAGLLIKQMEPLALGLGHVHITQPQLKDEVLLAAKSLLSIFDSLAEFSTICGPDFGNYTFDAFVADIETASQLSPLNLVEGYAEMPERAVDCLIKMFLRCLPHSASKTSHLYEVLLAAAAPSNPINIRLKVTKLLSRLRCDSRGALEIIKLPDSQSLAGDLCRTEATASTTRSDEASSTRTSMYDRPPSIRQSRSSAIDMTKVVRSRSATRSSNLREEYSRAAPPLWMYDGGKKGLPEEPPGGPSQVVYSDIPSPTDPFVLDISSWLDVVIQVLENDSDWEIYSYILVHLPSQLTNRTLCARHVRQLQTLHNLVVDQLEKGSFHRPPRHTGMKMGDVALCLYHILTMLVPYHEQFGRRELDNAVRTFLAGISKYDRAGKCCIDALALCCHEIPSVVDRHIFNIIQKMSQKIIQSLAVDVLEFLAGLARLPEAYSSATMKLPESHSSGGGEDETFFKKVFGICISYIQSTREQRQKSADESQGQSSGRSNRQSATSGEMATPIEYHKSTDVRVDLSEYIYILAYHVIIFWFLAIDINRRAQHVGWIARELAWKESSGNEVLEEQSQVILDMMHRTAFSNLGETEPGRAFAEPKETPIKKTWLLGMSIITVEVLPSLDIGQFTKRQASGTTHALYHHNTSRLPDHHIPDHNNTSGLFAAEQVDVYPNHMFLQLCSTIAPIPIPLQPVVLPDDDFTKRALSSFDRTDTVDGHKAGVIYIGDGQSEESKILANTCGTEDYEEFLSGLGTAVQLQGAKFNTQGLDRESNIDGTQTYAWRDRVTEIVFHVATMMPTDLENDPHSNNKKRHVGNDRVKIIYNNSGKAFNFDTFPSDFNNVNIVISPEAHTAGERTTERRKSHDAVKTEPSVVDQSRFYKVQTLCSPNFPTLSLAATPKVVSASVLPAFVRQIALNASVFAHVWSETLGQGKYISSWRSRLQQINRLRERYGNSQTSANVSYPMPTNAPAYVEGNEWLGTVAMGGMTERDQLLMGLDFTRWT